MARRYSAEQWAAWVEEQHESALSVRDFCDWIGVSQNAFYLWLRKLAAQQMHATVTQSSESQQSDVRSLFVPLTVVGSPVIEVDLPCGAIVRVDNKDHRCDACSAYCSKLSQRCFAVQARSLVHNSCRRTCAAARAITLLFINRNSVIRKRSWPLGVLLSNQQPTRQSPRWLSSRATATWPAP